MSPEFLNIERKSFKNRKFQWMPADTERNYHKVKKLMTIPYGPNDISYEYNSHGFRCDEFGDWKNYPYRILFAGCSMTEGIGVPLKDLWTKKLHKMICKKLDTKIPYWNIASGGTGIDHMARYIFNLKDYLKPQFIISILPNEVRRERHHEDRWSIWSLDTLDDENTKFLSDDRFVSYQTEKNLSMINLMLEEIDCKMLFTTPSEIDVSNFQNLINLDIWVEQIDYARDGIHAGPETNKEISKRAFDMCWPLIEQRLTNTK